MRQCARFVVDFLLVRHFYFFLKSDDVVSDLTKMARIHLWIFMSINRRDAINSNATTWKTVIVAVLSTAMFVSHCNQFRLVISAKVSSSFVFSSSCFSSFHRIVRLTFDWRCQEWVNTSHKMLQSKLNYSCRFHRTRRIYFLSSLWEQKSAPRHEPIIPEWRFYFHSLACDLANNFELLCLSWLCDDDIYCQIFHARA